MAELLKLIESEMVVSRITVVKLTKIAIISNSISGGGAERSMRLINQEMNLLGASSTLVCLNNSGNDFPESNEIILGRIWKSGILSTLRNYLDFVRIMSELQPKIVIANCELPELYVSFLFHRITKLICVEHTSIPWAGRRKIGFFIRLLLKLRKVTWVTVNKDQKGIWPFRNTFTVIQNPVAVPRLDLTSKLRAPFVFVGRIRKEKGIQMILEASADVGSSIDVYGTGDLEALLREEFKTGVNFKGFVSNPWEQIHPNQVLVVASEYEGDGIVIVESILAGTPILLLDNKDLRRFGFPENNYFANKTELIEKMRVAVDDFEQFKVTSSFATEFRSERNISKIVKLWQDLLR